MNTDKFPFVLIDQSVNALVKTKACTHLSIVDNHCNTKKKGYLLMSTKKTDANEANRLCPYELNEYMKKYIDLTPDERMGLYDWAAKGYSVYDNPYDICDEHGVTMDFIKAIRVYAEMLLDDSTDAQNKYCKRENLIGTDFKPFCKYARQPKIPHPNEYYFSLCLSEQHASSSLGNVCLYNGNGVPFSFGTQVNRRVAISGIVIYLTYIREAEKRNLDNTLEEMQDTEEFEAGEYAVDAIDEIIDLLEDIY
jgi:hypothetical protein